MSYQDLSCVPASAKSVHHYSSACGLEQAPEAPTDECKVLLREACQPLKPQMLAAFAPCTHSTPAVGLMHKDKPGMQSLERSPQIWRSLLKVPGVPLADIKLLIAFPSSSCIQQMQLQGSKWEAVLKGQPGG